MPREKEHDSAADRQRAYRERKRNAEGNVTPSVTNQGVTNPEKSDTMPDGVTPRPQAPKRRDVDDDGRPTTLRGLILEARAGTIVLSEREERAIRRHYGYADSEKRTLLERDAAARRIASKTVRGTRVDASGREVEEPVGPAGLSLIAYPTQTPNDLAPTPEQRQKLGETTGARPR